MGAIGSAYGYALKMEQREGPHGDELVLVLLCPQILSVEGDVGRIDRVMHYGLVQATARTIAFASPIKVATVLAAGEAAVRDRELCHVKGPIRSLPIYEWETREWAGDGYKENWQGEWHEVLEVEAGLAEVLPADGGRRNIWDIVGGQEDVVGALLLRSCDTMHEQWQGEPYFGRETEIQKARKERARRRRSKKPKHRS